MKHSVITSNLALAGRLEPTSLSLASGQVTCLVGPNGSGKTSLLHALAGIGRPLGDILVEGVDPRRLPPSQRARLLSYLPAGRDLAWPLTGHDLVALGLAEPNHDLVDRILERMELGAIADRRVDRLSTGERSRLLIARALVSEPRLLLLDEPIANLDPLWQLQLMDELRSLSRADDRTIVVAIHDLDMARIYADRLLIMKDGRIAADGEAADLLASNHIPHIFGIKATASGWRPLKLQADPQSSR